MFRVSIGVVFGRVSGWDGKGFLQYIQFEASFGKHIWFWQECWCDDEYDSSTNREASVDSLLLRQTKGQRGVEMLDLFGNLMIGTLISRPVFSIFLVSISSWRGLRSGEVEAL